jgi:AsmA protein
MKTALKVVLGVVAALVVLLVIAVVVVSNLDVNRYKPQIEAKVQQLTHRNFTLGDIHLSIYPVLGARLRDVKLANAAGFGDQPFVAAGTVNVGVHLMPLLLDRRVEVTEVQLVDATVNLATAADGRNNWDDLLQKPPQRQPAQATAPAAQPPSSGAVAIAVKSVSIENTALHYDDRKSGSRYSVDGFHLKTGSITPGTPFDVSLGFTAKLSHPELVAKVEGSGKASFDPAQKTYSISGLILKTDASGATLPNGKLSLELDGDVAATADSARIDGLKLTLDDTHITGKAALASLARRDATFALKVDQLDVDRYMGSTGGKSGSKPAAPAKAAPPASAESDRKPLPFDALDTFGADGTVDIGTLKAKGATLSNVQLKVAAKRGGDKRLQLAAQLYQGTVAAQTLIVPGAVPRLGQTARLQDVALQPLVQALMGKDLLSGKGNVDLDLNASGRSVADLKRNLNGNVTAALRNGAVKGINLAAMVRQAQALLKGGTLQSGGTSEQTDFSAIDFKGHFTNGVLHDDLQGQSPYFRVTGSGQADIALSTIDYEIKPTVVKSPEGQGGANLAGIMVPIKVGGTFSNPTYRVDVGTALKQEAVKKLTNRLLEKNPKLEQQLKGLGALFGHKPDNNAPSK